jgi:hypothetical protein
MLKACAAAVVFFLARTLSKPTKNHGAVAAQSIPSMDAGQNQWIRKSGRDCCHSHWHHFNKV